MLAYALGLLLLGLDLTIATPLAGRPLAAFTAVSIAAGLAFLLLVLATQKLGGLSGRMMWLVFGMGLAMRLLLVPAEPIREDDHYRYMLDGAALLRGLSPYALSPSQVAADPALHAQLTGPHGAAAFARINHPELKTIYPPVAQGVFGLAHLIAPWRAEGLRLVYLVLDAAGFFLLLRLLRMQGGSVAFTALYWWNPLVLAQIYGHVHFEVILFAPLLLILLAAAQGRSWLAGLAVGLAAAAKVWPALLLAPLLAFFRRAPQAALQAAAIFACVAALGLWPLIAAAIEPQSGVAAYASRWLFNNPPGTMLHGTVMGSGIALGLSPDSAQALVRLVFAGASGLAALLIAFQVLLGRLSLPGALLGLSLAAFLIAPAQFPWYALWFAPFLALVPSLAVASFVATVPLYSLLPLFEAAGTEHFYHWGVAWVPLLVFTGFWAWRGLHVR